MIVFKKSINHIENHQVSQLPDHAEKVETPKTLDEMMRKAFPIAVLFCCLLVITMFIKTFVCQKMVVSRPCIVLGFGLGFLLLPLHELLHAVVYPKPAMVTIGKIKGKMTFVALASYPMKRSRFILMCLLPFVLGIIPFAVFVASPSEYTALNGIMFGMASMGMVSPYADVYNVVTVLGKADKNDCIMFYKDDLYKIP